MPGSPIRSDSGLGCAGPSQEVPSGGGPVRLPVLPGIELTGVAGQPIRLEVDKRRLAKAKRAGTLVQLLRLGKVLPATGLDPLLEDFEPGDELGVRERAVTGTLDVRLPEHARVGHGWAAGLAANGFSNRDIAQQLYVTPKTVEVHLSNAYRKLEVDSRRDLPRALAGTA